MGKGRSQTRNRGFTLPVLMASAAIVAILAAIAFPSFESTMRSNRVATATNELLASLSLARMEALRSPGGAGICASDNGSVCGSDWNSGWIVWIDGNGNGQPGDAGDRVLRHVQGRNTLTVTAASAGGATAASRISFDQRGRVSTHTRRLTVQPKVCGTANDAREINIALTGQAVVTRKAC